MEEQAKTTLIRSTDDKDQLWFLMDYKFLMFQLLVHACLGLVPGSYCRGTNTGLARSLYRTL